ncbi:hypothetical protein, partial [Candidatus Magnetobacterium casense]
TKMSTRICKQVGGGIVGYLMELPMEYRNEDMAAKHRAVDESEAEMRKLVTRGSSEDSRYGKVEINKKSEEVRPV